MRSSFLPALSIAIGLSLSAAACGQPGVVAAGSTGTNSTSSAGGSGGAGGTGSGGETGGADTALPLKVLNWNCHNFFDTTKDTSSPDEQVPTKSDYDAKVVQVGSVLKVMDPDIAILPEVENLAILDELNTKELGGVYKTAITESNDFRGLDIGVLSKYPIDDVVTHVKDVFTRLDLVGGKSYSYSRDAVEVHLNYNTRNVVLFGVHYRSKGDGSPESDDSDKRLAEAQHTRALADETAKKDPKAAIMILGDYNDVPGSPAVNWTIQGNPKNSPKVTFFSAADYVAEADKYTFVYNGTKELIDHQIMNPVMHTMLDTMAVVIRHGKDVEAASDHSPLMATYQIK